MTRITLLIFSLILLISCEDEQDSQTALNATLDFDLYVSIEAHALENEDGSYLVQGITQNENLTMKISSIEEGSYQFGGNSDNYGLFENSSGDAYSTSPDGSGELTITEWNIEEATITGSFGYTAILPAVDTLKVSNGFFYRVPVTSY